MKYIKYIAIPLLLVGCSVLIVSKSNDTIINQRLDEDLDAEVDLFSKDSIKK